jgi:hypothetical protein
MQVKTGWQAANRIETGHTADYLLEVLPGRLSKTRFVPVLHRLRQSAGDEAASGDDAGTKKQKCKFNKTKDNLESPFHSPWVGNAGGGLTCQLALPASAGANSLHLQEHPASIWIVELAPQSKCCFLPEHDFNSLR